MCLLVACMTACRATRTISVTTTSVSPQSDTTKISADVVEDYFGAVNKNK